MANKDTLYVVKDDHGDQWLCPSRPVVALCWFDKYWYWAMKQGGMTLSVCQENGCIKLSKSDCLDESSFEGANDRKAFKVSLTLSRVLVDGITSGEKKILDKFHSDNKE